MLLGSNYLCLATPTAELLPDIHRILNARLSAHPMSNTEHAHALRLYNRSDLPTTLPPGINSSMQLVYLQYPCRMN